MKRDPVKEQFWRSAITEADGSGQSVREFCRQKGLKESLFHAWRRQLKQRDAESAADQTGFMELVAPTGGGGAGVSIRIDERISIVLQRGFDRELLKAALGCLCEAGRPTAAEAAGA